jgi:RNA polymerase sigma-70 factor (ECF subfamily)
MRPLRATVSDRSVLDDLTLARAQRGDEAAFRELVVCHQQAVFSYLWRMVGASGTRTLIEDLTQDTFVRVHHGLPRFVVAGPARLSTWILTIATRVALNALRRPRLRIEALGRRARAVAAEAPDPAIGMIVREALDRMTPDHRAILLLREYHQLDYAEIADALEIDLGTVRSRLSRARSALRAALSEEAE